MLEAFSPTQPLHRVEFLYGIRYGVGALALGGIAGGLSLWKRGKPVPIVGYLVSAAALAALVRTSQVTGDELIGFALLGVAGLLGDLFETPAGVTALLAFPGAWVIAARTDVPAIPWILWLVLGSIVVGGIAVADFDRRFRDTGAGPVLLAITLVGIYYTVPDTEQALALLGAGLPILLLGWPRPLASIGRGGAFLLLGVIAWVSALGGIGRPSSIVGALSCMGLLVIEPVAYTLTLRHSSFFEGAKAWIIFPVAVAHLGLVFFAARVAGVRPSVNIATSIVVATFSTAILLLAFAMRAFRARNQNEMSVPEQMKVG